jgi:ADP-L-glycero-D-manno-heptose 6-epimerase
MGACSVTTERDADYLMKNNYAYTLSLAEYCLKHKIRFIYASSAATYGSGECGYSDDNATSKKLSPLNIYGYSKQAFDLHVLARGWDKLMVGLKFFNVFGPNEYHKGDMQSVAYKAWLELSQGKEFRLFRSHRPDFVDGEQKRDFVWIKDVVQIVLFFLDNAKLHGIFNAGSGKASSFNELLCAVYGALGLAPQLEYTDMPEGLRGRYQYFTEADISKLRQAGYTAPFTPLDEAVREYIQDYLGKERRL